jgi:hypothetical protein
MHLFIIITFITFMTILMAYCISVLDKSKSATTTATRQKQIEMKALGSKKPKSQDDKKAPSANALQNADSSGSSAKPVVAKPSGGSAKPVAKPSGSSAKRVSEGTVTLGTAPGSIQITHGIPPAAQRNPNSVYTKPGANGMSVGQTLSTQTVSFQGTSVPSLVIEGQAAIMVNDKPVYGSIKNGTFVPNTNQTTASILQQVVTGKGSSIGGVGTQVGHTISNFTSGPQVVSYQGETETVQAGSPATFQGKSYPTIHVGEETYSNVNGKLYYGTIVNGEFTPSGTVNTSGQLISLSGRPQRGVSASKILAAMATGVGTLIGGAIGGPPGAALGAGIGAAGGSMFNFLMGNGGGGDTTKQSPAASGKKPDTLSSDVVNNLISKYSSSNSTSTSSSSNKPITSKISDGTTVTFDPVSKAFTCSSDFRALGNNCSPSQIMAGVKAFGSMVSNIDSTTYNQALNTAIANGKAILGGGTKALTTISDFLNKFGFDEDVHDAVENTFQNLYGTTSIPDDPSFTNHVHELADFYSNQIFQTDNPTEIMSYFKSNFNTLQNIYTNLQSAAIEPTSTFYLPRHDIYNSVLDSLQFIRDEPLVGNGLTGQQPLSNLFAIAAQ